MREGQLVPGRGAGAYRARSQRRLAYQAWLVSATASAAMLAIRAGCSFRVFVKGPAD